ncbi:hypothetical protein [Mongoliibacter ruber]|uniref:Lipoprotein n=1 Tax=Mongoliibacter ruber TaxID=1750599 RepID=A0A2T0WEX1_9BACT|nr:hypothetical protein [Mongoliibacter ruber]PRY85257.1 hypothetical protein CLW00_1134 [Mongoliibacter ruber]
MYRNLFVVFSFLLLSSCYGDIDKNISTDLQIEGNEVFNISLVLDESLIFAFDSFEDYRKADTTSVLGCPNILIDETEKKVTLEFMGNRQCVNENNLSRTGKIHVRFINESSFTSTILEYDGYTVRGNKISGKREFIKRRMSNGFNNTPMVETFENFLIIDEKGSSSQLKGDFEHRTLSLNNISTEIVSNGSLEGRNITGRPILMNRNQPKRYSITCLKGGFVIPSSGSETWQVVRHTNQATSHQLIFESEAACQNLATITLHDGRTIQYRQL